MKTMKKIVLPVSALICLLLLLFASACMEKELNNPFDPNYALQKVANPTFSPAGGTYTSAQTVTISCSTPGATIRYTTNGSEPNSSSTAYSSAINVAANTTLKAKGFKAGYTESNTTNAAYTINIPTVATPTFNPAGGSYTGSQTVSISCSTTGATIRYTTNGSEPTSNSPTYSSALNIMATTTIKAKAYKSGYTDSATASSIYTITAPQTVATPTFNPAGGTYTSAQSVSIECTTSGATIRYTTNGSEPTSSSTIFSSAINITATTTIKAKAFKTGFTDSAIASSVYTITPPQTVATPSFSPAGGTYTSVQSVTISCATALSTIRYTTDGSEPTSSSTIFSSAINITATTTIKAKGFRDGYTSSATASATYTISTPQVVATPIFYPAGGSYTSAQSVIISCSTIGSTIRYTANGTEPTSSSPEYTSAITISTTLTLKAKAFKTGYTNSATASANYTINIPQTVATPTFYPPAGTYSSAQTVNIQCTTAGSIVRFTTNGSNPTSTSTQFTAPITISTNTTIKAKAFKTGWTDSAIATAGYTIGGTVATPTFNPAAGAYSGSVTVSMQCTTADASIRYTTNGTIPTSTSTLYIAPITLSTTTTIRAKAFKTGWTDSGVAVATYTITGGGTWLTWADQIIGDSIGTGAAAVFSVAHKFDATDLQPYHGQALRQVKFYPAEQNCTYTLKVWTGSTTPTTVVYSGVVNNPTISSWNHIILTSPVNIPTTGSLWVGYEVNTQAGYPAGCDDGPAIEGKGNVMYYNGAWTTLTGLSPTLTYNWGIQSYVSSGTRLTNGTNKAINEPKNMHINQGILKAKNKN